MLLSHFVLSASLWNSTEGGGGFSFYSSHAAGVMLFKLLSLHQIGNLSTTQSLLLPRAQYCQAGAGRYKKIQRPPAPKIDPSKLGGILFKLVVTLNNQLN